MDTKEEVKKLLGSVDMETLKSLGDQILKGVDKQIDECCVKIESAYKDIQDSLVEKISGFDLKILPAITGLIKTLETIDSKDAVILYFYLGSQILHPKNVDLPFCLTYLGKKYPRETHPDVWMWIDEVDKSVVDVFTKSYNIH